MNDEILGVVSCSVLKEIQAVLSWVPTWRKEERKKFLQEVVALSRPQLDDLLGLLDTIKIERLSITALSNFFVLSHNRVLIK